MAFRRRASLQAFKFVQQAHDLHYYTLGNPDHTAAFVVLPLTWCLLWALDSSVSPGSRRWLLFAAAVMAVMIVMLWVRFELLVCALLVAGVIICSPLARTKRVAAGLILVTGFAALAVSSSGSYVFDVFSTGSGSSGAVRASSIAAGWHAFLHHPLTGLGLGEFGASTGVPAHSSIIQAGAETGIVGLAGLTLLTVACSWRTPGPQIRRGTWRGLTGGAAVAAGVYTLVSAVSPGADEGLMSGLVSVFGLTLALSAATAQSAESAWAGPPAGRATRLAMDALSRFVSGRWAALRPWLGTLAYGLAWGALAFVLEHQHHAIFWESTRATAMAHLLAAHQHGFGPLVEMLGPDRFQPAALGDDPGGFLFMPLLMDLFHFSSLSAALTDAFAVSLGIGVAVYPYLIRQLTGSRVAAAASASDVHRSFSFLRPMDFYWVPAVALSVCIPWLLLIAKRKRPSLMTVAVIAAVAGISTTFRSNSGLGIAIALCIVVLTCDPDGSGDCYVSASSLWPT